MADKGHRNFTSEIGRLCVSEVFDEQLEDLVASLFIYEGV